MIYSTRGIIFLKFPLQLANAFIDIGIWDYDPEKGKQFIGEVLVELATASLDDTPHWHTLQKSIDNPLMAKLKRRQSRASLCMLMLNFSFQILNSMFFQSVLVYITHI